MSDNRGSNSNGGRSEDHGGKVTSDEEEARKK